MLSDDGKTHRPLTSGMVNDFSPRFSPDGKRLAYVSTRNGSPQIFIRYLDTAQEFQVAQLQFGAGSLSWSPNGQWLAFNQFVPAKPASLGVMPPAPKGAEWAKPAKVIDRVTYRADGAGYLQEGFTHVFVVPSEGGTPRQVTKGEYNYNSSLSWLPDSEHLLLSANMRDDRTLNLNDSSLYRLNIQTGELKQLTERVGPEGNPEVSPDGKRVAFVGFDDRYQGYQNTELYIMSVDGGEMTSLTSTLDRSVSGFAWGEKGRHLFIQYDDKGNTKLAKVSLKGKLSDLTDDVGGTSFGRPYSGGSFTVSNNDRIAFTAGNSMDLAQVATIRGNGKGRKVHTDLNAELFGHRALATVEEVWTKSTHDGLAIQGWLAKPADFDPKKKYPLILEIHGGPFTNYGTRFSPEVQLFASKGYLVLYANPRGSTSYGAEFGNAIHHAYPGYDYDDLISIVDEVIGKGYVDEEQLFVTGGSGGGVLTAWIVGKTDRFKAAVVAKPVINWTSFVLTADFSPFFVKYWFPKMPWEDPDGYWKRSPLSLVGNVKTPTMLLTGEADYRTPISETEQYYQALKLRGVDTMMVRIPGASHGITRRPSNLIAKVNHILAWFEKYRKD